MVQAAKDNLEAELHKQGPQSRDRLTNEYQKSFREIQSFAHEEFVNRLGMEREQRRWAGGASVASRMAGGAAGGAAGNLEERSIRWS